VKVGTNSPTLTLSNVTDLNEGYYYCIISNNSPTPVASQTAQLEVKRLVAWYAFENDITDSAGDNDGTPIKADPNSPFTYTAGPFDLGQAISLNGVDEAVLIPRSIQNSMTIEFWVKTTQTGGVGGGWFDGRGLVDGEVTGFNQNDFGTSLRGNFFSFGVGNITGAQTTIQSTTPINNGEWHYCVATRDHVTGQIRVYVDGSREAFGTAPLGTKDTPEFLRIGSIQTGINHFAGQLDDVKLHNYPLDELTIASFYNAVSGDSACVTSQRPDAKYDLNGDCIVDLTDFAEFAGAWLDCGLYPDCQ
jgi:hypothetical protein